jgi:acyl carrier protein
MSERDDVVRIIRDVSPTATIRADQYGDSLLDLGLDSLDHATILLQVEEKFGVKIPDDAAASLVTVTAIAEFVASHRAA